jgi:hypothetical protein
MIIQHRQYNGFGLDAAPVLATRPGVVQATAGVGAMTTQQKLAALPDSDIVGLLNALDRGTGYADSRADQIRAVLPFIVAEATKRKIPVPQSLMPVEGSRGVVGSSTSASTTSGVGSPAVGTSKSDVQAPAQISWAWLVGGAAVLYLVMKR